MGKLRLFLVFVLIVFCCGICQASPFLKCTKAPEPDVVSYEVSINGAIQPALGIEVDGKIHLLDLDGMTPGAYEFNARAVDQSGLRGDWIPIPFVGTKPAVLTGLEIGD